MHESDTFLAILDEGQAMAARELIIGWGEDRFGAPDATVLASLNNITDLERLKRIARQTPKAANWQEILETP